MGEIKMMQYVKRLVCCLVVFSTFCYSQQSTTNVLGAKNQNDGVRSFKFVKFASFYKNPEQIFGFKDSQILYVSADKIWFNDDCSVKITKKEELDMDVRLYQAVKDAGSPKIFDSFLQKNFNQSKVKFIYYTKPIVPDNRSCKLNHNDFYEMQDGSFLIDAEVFHHFVPIKEFIKPIIGITPLTIKDIASVRFTPIDVLNEKQKDIYKKYGFSTERSCLCGGASFKIDPNQQKAYITDVCSAGTEVIATLKINKIEEYGSGLKISMVDKEGGFLRLYLRREDSPIVRVVAEFNSNSELGSRFDDDVKGKPFVDIKFSNKFKKEECEDFDG
jgi:hypothetical protein